MFITGSRGDISGPRSKQALRNLNRHGVYTVHKNEIAVAS